MKHHKFNQVSKITKVLIAVMGISALLLSGNNYQTAARGSSLGELKPVSRGFETQCLNMDQTRNVYNLQTGVIRFVGTEPGQPIQQPVMLSAAASPEEAARGYFSVCGPLFGLRNQAEELVVKAEHSEDDGWSVVRFQQVYQGIPVLAGELIVQLDGSKNIISVNGETLPDISVDTAASIDSNAARIQAMQVVANKYQLSTESLTITDPELWIYQPSLIQPRGGFTSLVWRMQVTTSDLAPIRELVLVNAHRGNVELSFNQIDSARNRKTYTANNTLSLPGTLVCEEGNPTCPDGDKDAKNAHIYAGDTYDFYRLKHNRDSINNAGMDIISTVHYGLRGCNAFWNGAQLVYSDGCFIVADDIVAHEYTHGVTQYESGLFSYYQSGAIKESLADIWGEFVDLGNGKGNDAASVRWLIGEDTSTGAIRNMKDPPAKGDPDKMTSPKYDTITCDNYNDSDNCDNGGVHTNSGVNNKAVYLLTDGGSFNGNTVSAMGVLKVAKIYYEAQTNLLTSGADYADLHEVIRQACLDLVGKSGITSANCQNVRTATLAVEMDKQPVLGYNTEAPLCAAGQNPVTLFFDNLENSSRNWEFGVFKGTGRWQLDSPWGSFAHSGEHFLYADDAPASVTDAYTALKTNVRLPANAYLHFSHAYGFEGAGHDGGVLEYTTNGGASWTDAGSLFVNNGYTGTITSSTNPMNGKPAFVEDSHGYISSRVDLSTLVDKNVRFRWRMGLDSTEYDWGWWLDDVHIYRCGTPVSKTKSFYSDGKYDGHILESGPTSEVGGTVYPTMTTFKLGDNFKNRQFRVILSFDTASLPNDAVITDIMLKIKKMKLVGIDPFTTYIPLYVDIRKPYFGTGYALEPRDFQADANKVKVGQFGTVPVSDWYSVDIGATAYKYVNVKGITQLRLYFRKGDNGNSADDYIEFFSGNAGNASKPVLVLTYNYVP